MGNIPGLPKVHLHNPVLAYEVGDDFMDYWFKAARASLILRPGGRRLHSQRENQSGRAIGRRWGRTARYGAADHRPTNGSTGWLRRRCGRRRRDLRHLRRHSCHGGQSDRRYGLAGLSWAGAGSRKAGIPIVYVPGCPVQPDNFMETLLYLLYQARGSGADDSVGRRSCVRTGCLANTVHEGCDRGRATTSRATLRTEYGSPKCIVKLGCWGPVVKCNVPKRGWMNGLGGCPNVGGICIGCTMPGFPDKFMPFMDEPPGAKVSSGVSSCYGGVIRSLRNITNRTLNKEPRWRHSRAELTTGYTAPALRVKPRRAYGH